MHPLDGARLKVERARDHLDTLDLEIKAFRSSKPYRVVREFDSEQRRHIFRVKIDRVLPTHIELTIGDAVHNLRATLDHIVWQLARRAVEEPSTYTAFPIFDDLKRWRQNMTDKRCMLLEVTDGARDVIEAMQPYHRPDPHQSILWVLHQLDIVDKHRTIQIIEDVFPGPPSVQVSASVGSSNVNLFNAFLGPFNDGDELMWFAEDVQLPDNLEEQFPFQVRFAQGITRGAELTALGQLYYFIRDEVVPKFEPFF